MKWHVAFLAIFLFACAPPQETPTRLNLLLIAVDTLRADHLGAYGYTRETSPEIDRFIESAVAFDDAHSSSSWTLPAFASLMTSHYASTHGCWQFSSSLDDSFVTLAEILRDGGYATAAIVSHTFLGAAYGLGQGFDAYDERLVEAQQASHQAISSPAVSAAAIAALDRMAEGHRPDGPEGDSQAPWFLFVHFFDPHAAYHPHGGFSEAFGTALPVDRYDGEIAFTDHHVGMLLDHLRALGLEDDTVIALVADHGEEFREHGSTEHGRTLFAEVERIPLAIRAPGIAPRRIAEAVSAVDFLPTVLTLLDTSTPFGVAGRSLVPAMHGATLPDRGILMETRLDLLTKLDVEAYVSGRWKLIVETPKHERRPEFTRSRQARPRTSLFDRIADPAEKHDVARANPDVVERMRAALRDTVATAEARARSFPRAAKRDLPPAELKLLESLGYVERDPDTGGN